MAIHTVPAAERPYCPAQAASAALHDLDCQRLRILRCTAHAMASSPGGLRFRLGSRPWLDGLPASRPVFADCKLPTPDAGTPPVAS